MSSIRGGDVVAKASRSGAARTGWLVAGVGAVAWCALLVLKAVTAGTAAFDQIVGWSNILALVVVVVGLAVGAFRRHSQTDIPASRSLEDCESFLASSTLASEAAERARLIGRGPFVADALDIRYQVIPTGTPTEEASGGSFRDIVKFYRRTKTKRLVILGEAGSGKTVLALNLLVELSSMAVSGARSTGKPRSIPFQLHASLLLGPGDLNSCLVQALSERLRVPQRFAEQIVRRGRILPFIDGLDEIEISPRATGPLLRVIAKLNEHIVGTGEGAMVVTCRADTYEQLQAAGHGIGSSTAIRISDLTSSQCIAYIEGRAPASSPTVAEWVAYLRDQSSISEGSAKALFSSIRTPWRLALLLAAVSDGLSVERFRGLGRSTEDLGTSRSCSGLRQEDEVLDLLLSRYVPAAIKFHGTGKFADVENATRWLGFLSRSLSSDPSSGPEINIVPRDLWRIGGERAARLVDAIVWTLPLAALLVVSDVALLDDVLEHSRGAGWALALTLPLGLWFYYVAARAIYTRDPEPLVLRVELPTSFKQELAKVRREAFWQGAKSGLGIGLLFGAGIFLVPLISTGVTTPAEPFGYRVIKYLAFCVVVASLVGSGNAVLRYLVNRRYVALAALPAKTNYVRLCLTTLVRFFAGIVLVALTITVGIVFAVLQNELAPLQQYPALFWQLVPTFLLLEASLAIALLVLAYAASFFADFAGLAFTSRFLSGLLVAGVRRRFPFRAQSFLYWCWEAEVLRTSGGFYQFKHLQLQQWLSTRASGAVSVDQGVLVRRDHRQKDERAPVELP